MAEKKEIPRILSKTEDEREQVALDLVWKARKDARAQIDKASEAVKAIRDQQKEARAKMRVHEAGARFLILRYVIRMLKAGGKPAEAMVGMINTIANELKPHGKYTDTKVETDRISLARIIKEYKK